METSRTVVVHDTSGPAAVTKIVQRLIRSESRTTEIVVVSHQSLALPGTLARRVRLVRERTPDRVARAVAELVAGGASLVTAGPRQGTTRTSISACLIVKDEEQVLGACLEAIGPFVDEVVVYDTGSADSTLDIARRSGAVVIEGYWNDHFGDARNRASQHCTSEWIVFVDADEVAAGDPDALRRRLENEVADVLPVVIASTTWTGGEGGEEAVVRRIARRGRLRWSGNLHEHLVAAEGLTDVTASFEAPPIRLLHSGYQSTVVHEKSKGSRNVDLALAALNELDDQDSERSSATANYGRSLILAGRNEEGIDVLEEIRRSQAHPTIVVGAGRAAVDVLVPAGRLDEARAWLAAMAASGESRGNLCVRRASIALAEGDATAAKRALDEAPAATAARTDKDCWGAPFDVDATVGPRVAVELSLDRPDAALSLLRHQATTSPDRVDVAHLFTAMSRVETSWEEVVRWVPDHFLDRSVRAVMTMEGTGGLQAGLRWCEAFASVHPGDHRPLVAGCLLAARGDLKTALTWSLAAREAGQPQLCPVRAGAEDPNRPVHERALWWAILADSFGEFDAHTRFTETLAETSPVDLGELRSSLEHLAPALAGTGVETR